MATTEQSFSFPKAWAATRRRALPALVAFAAVAVGAISAAAFWPPTYSATGTILIEQQELPADLVRSTVTTYASQRIQVIAQRVMTTENLMGIVQRYNLYPDLRRSKPREEIVATMRHATNLQMISADVIDPRDGHPTKATIAFSLGFSNRTPELAAQVANELVSLYLQQNIESRQKSTQDAVSFLQSENVRLNKEIEATQAQIATFKAKHEHDLPELSQLNLTEMNQAQSAILETDTQIQANEQQIIYLDGQLAQINPTAQIYDSTGQRVQSPDDLLKTLRSQYTRDSAIYAPDHPDVVRLKREIAALEKTSGDANSSSVANDYRRELEDAQAQLSDAQHRYAADHPDVVRLQRLVDSLQSKVQDAAKSSSPTSASAPAVAASSSAQAAADNPPYINLKAQREAAASERQALKDKRAVLQAKYDDYERRLASTPAVEREYAELLRNLTSAQTQYADIRHRLEEANIADNLETERKSERFTLIEPPLVPEQPTSPNRPLIIIFGLFAALLAAGGTVWMLESADGTVRGREDLTKLVSLAPLAVIPHMMNSVDFALRRRRRRYALIGTASGVVIAVLAVHLFYRPLDVLWVVALRRLGVDT